jgi:cobaltochelatase CobT
MKARIAPVAVLVDVFARALEMAGVANEVLGFTTLAWHGGRARRDWLRAGQPRHPGRLNEIGHLVFKDAGTPWRRARRGIAALLKPEFFREGVDGEAVQWAVARMQGCDEARRILLVVSDGSPMDAATSLANDERYLDHHLRDVVGQLEATRQAEIGGIGVGLDLSPYYAHSKVLDLDAPLGSHALQDILDVIAGRRRRR